MSSWVANFGKGAYREGLYWEDISKNIHYGYGDGASNQQFYETWEMEEDDIHDIGYNEEDTIIE
jgi:hypothetical protein